MIWQWNDLAILAGGFLAAAGGAILYHVPVRQALICGIIGMLASVAKMGAEAGTLGTVLSTFLATLLVAFLSQIAARVEKMPVTVFLIPCIFLFVPGAGMYHTAFSLIENRIDDAIRNLFETLEVAGAIALAIFTVDTVFRRRDRLHTNCT